MRPADFPAKVRRPRADLEHVAGVLASWADGQGCAWSFGGSWRRGSELVGDLDVVAFVPTLEAVELPAGFVVERSGPMVAQGWLEDVRVDLWACRPECAGVFLYYVTGPAELNVAMRTRARELGYRLGQYALQGYPGPTTTEADVAAALGLPHLEAHERDGWRDAYRPGAGHGVHVGTVMGSTGTLYELHQLEDGRRTCTCPGYRYRRSCKHLAAA